MRAGVKCTSAYVAAADAASQGATSPPYATGSRGIKIVPDELFSPQVAVPVRGATQGYWGFRLLTTDFLG